MNDGIAILWIVIDFCAAGWLLFELYKSIMK